VVLVEDKYTDRSGKNKSRYCRENVWINMKLW